MIRARDRVALVLARDERLVDVFVSASSAFETLRSPAMRKTMGHLLTVEQAARIAGTDARALVERLNRALGEEASHEEESMPETEETPEAEPVPPGLLATPKERLVDVDVREDLRAGREPFRRILDASRSLPDGSVLRVRAIFEPAPLYAVLGKAGLDHFTERLAPDDWRVWFFRSAGAGASRGEQAAADVGNGDDLLVIDVRDLEPPEPMERTFEALATMPRGKTLLHINSRVPRFLLPKLEERGFSYEIREQSRDLVRLFIRHKQP